MAWLVIPLAVGALTGSAMAWIYSRQGFLFTNIVFGILGALLLYIVTYLVMTNDVFILAYASIVGALVITYVSKFYPPDAPSPKSHKKGNRPSRSRS